MRKLRNKRLNHARGFTLIEVVVVMAIIAVLAALVVGAINIARNTAKETVHRSNARTLETGMQAYYAKYRTGPIYTTDGQGNTFTELADILDVQLAPTECDDPANFGRGGGRTWIMASGFYTINPYIANCPPAGEENELPESDKITGEMPLPPM